MVGGRPQCRKEARYPADVNGGTEISPKSCDCKSHPASAIIDSCWHFAVAQIAQQHPFARAARWRGASPDWPTSAVSRDKMRFAVPGSGSAVQLSCAPK